MKLEARRIEAYLADPGASRAALVFGEDAGLVRSRVRRLIVSIAGNVEDPFRTVSLSRDSLASLSAELSSRSLIGGRRVVHVSDATDAACAFVERAFSQPSEGFLVVEAGVLAAKSKLRVLFEKLSDAASIPCYPLERVEAGTLFARTMADFAVRLDKDAQGWVEQRLSLDRDRVMGDARLLALYLHPRKVASLADVQSCLGDGAGSTAEDIAYAAMGGLVRDADRVLDAALGDGAAPVAVIVAVLAHVTRLHRCVSMMAGGMSATDAVGSLRPPVFYKRQGGFVRSLTVWSVTGLADAARMLGATELGCKQTGAPAEMLVRNVVARLALNAAARIERRSRG